ncbi:MAG: hypothetical protein ACOYMF_05460 [Bacteroidales bacterium]
MNIKAKINVNNINKSKLFQGEKGIYLNVVLIDHKTEYSDFIIVHEQTKEERAANIKGEILGNGSWMVPKEEIVEPLPPEKFDDLPF